MDALPVQVHFPSAPEVHGQLSVVRVLPAAWAGVRFLPPGPWLPDVLPFWAHSLADHLQQSPHHE